MCTHTHKTTCVSFHKLAHTRTHTKKKSMELFAYFSMLCAECKQATE